MGVGRPWGVTLFWVLLAVVVPAALFRIGMAVVDRARPSGGRPSTGRARARTSAFRRPTGRTGRRTSVPATATAPSHGAARDDEPTTVLPWFSPDSAPSAPESSPTTKGHS